MGRSVGLLSCATLALIAAWIGCGRNDDLGLGTGVGGASGAGGQTSTTSSAVSSSTTRIASSTGAGGSASSSSGTGGSEPNLPTTLTVVNGINDYDAIRLCFLPDPTPWPASAAGLAFGASARVDLTTLPAGVPLTVWVVSGNLPQTASLTCPQILALAAPDGGASSSSSSGSSSGAGGGDAGSGTGGAGGSAPDAGNVDAGSDAGDTDAGSDAGLRPVVVVSELASIPASALTSERSLLFVPSGCMGGNGHDNGGAPNGCGSGYTSATPTAAPVLVSMSRIQAAKDVSLQVVSASPAIQPMDVHLLPAVDGAAEVTLTAGLAQGAIAPTPPFRALTAAAYGSLATVQINTYSPGATQKSSSTQLSTILAGSAVTQAGFVNGANLVFVAVGANPGTAAGPFWHPLTYALVSAD